MNNGHPKPVKDGRMLLLERFLANARLVIHNTRTDDATREFARSWEIRLQGEMEQLNRILGSSTEECLPTVEPPATPGV